MSIDDLSIFQETYIQRALIASILVGIMCGLLGCFIVLRNMALIGDALSHAILPGVVVGYMIGGVSILALFVGAVGAGLVAALLITWLQRNVRTKQDAAIGVVFSAMFALGVIGISILTQQQGVHLDMKDFLFGNILGVGNDDLWLTGLVAFYVLMSIVAFYRYFFMTTFEATIAETMGVSAATVHYFLMLLLSFTVVASLHTVGVIMVVGMLVIPASTAYLLTDRLRVMLFLAAMIGVFSAVSGLVIAILLNTTPGPAMTLVCAGCYFSAVLFSPKRGLFVQKWRKWKHVKRERLEDALKALAFLHENGKELNLQHLANALHTNIYSVRKLSQRLEAQGLVRQQKNVLHLSSQGMQRAYQLIRSHRVWETYLAQELGQQPDQIHDHAEKFEHLLPAEFINQVENFLGNPVLDPHGSTIPQTGNGDSLSNVSVGKTVLITTAQMNDEVVLALWQLGITPNTPFTITEIHTDKIDLKFEAKNLSITRHLAQQIRVMVIKSNVYSD